MEDVAPNSEETQGLLDQIGDGGREAFDRLFAQYRPFIRKVVELRLDTQLRARVDASDVVQETQMEAFRRLPDYLERQPMPFRLWLRKTACERLIMARRQHRNASRRSVGRELPWADHSTGPLAEQLAGSVESPSQQLTQQELAARVREAVEQLPEVDREILLMRNYEGLSYAEVGAILDITAVAARKRNGRALIRLHQLLTATGLTESQL